MKRCPCVCDYVCRCVHVFARTSARAGTGACARECTGVCACACVLVFVLMRTRMCRTMCLSSAAFSYRKLSCCVRVRVCACYVPVRAHACVCTPDQLGPSCPAMSRLALSRPALYDLGSSRLRHPARIRPHPYNWCCRAHTAATEHGCGGRERLEDYSRVFQHRAP